MHIKSHGLRSYFIGQSASISVIEMVWFCGMKERYYKKLDDFFD
jgi:hypothetical protein